MSTEIPAPGTAGWNDAMYRRHPTPYGRGVAGRIQAARTRAILSLAAVRPDDRVLEVGCEAGGLLACVPPCARLAGADISEAALADARRRLSALGRPFELHRADALAGLPFASGEFTVVLCSEVLEHVPDPSRLLDTIRAVCDPCTRVVLSVPLERPKLVAKRVLERLGLLRRLFPGIEEGASEWHLHGFSRPMLDGLLQGRFDVDIWRSVWGCHVVCACHPASRGGP